ncbi:MAG TPA: LysE family transporter [Ramlibacter sp.]|nr:LysE family transporter [Ramlibacter sp.]
MSDVTTLLGIAAAITVAAVSPGPTLLMVARTAVARTRGDGLAAALGVGVAGVLYAIAALAGLRALLLSVPSVAIAIKVAGGGYLIYLAIRLLRGAKTPLELSEHVAQHRRAPVGRSVLLGLTTHLSNPKTVVVYASVFTAFLPGRASFALVLAVPVAIFLVEFGWYALVALALAAGRPRRIYARLKASIDRAAGATLIGVGINLCWSAWADAIADSSQVATSTSP